MTKYKVLKYYSSIKLEEEMNRLAEEGYVVDKAFYNPDRTANFCVCVIMKLEDTTVCESDTSTCCDSGCKADQYTY